jgi:Gram-negative bacterial TonB protein C-terminal
VIRERTYANLLIGLVLSVLLHAYILMWGPPFSMPTPALRPPPEVEVQLREWPMPAPASPSVEAMKLDEPPPAVSTPAPAAKPVLPPNTQALQDAVQGALTPTRPDRVDVQLPERLPALPTMNAQHDPIRLAEGLRDSIQYEPRLADVAALPELPAPERQRPETRVLPPLPTLAPPGRRETAPTRPATITIPSPQPTSPITGPASERQVIFQPPPPRVTVESESEIELRFWILPNGAVGRVVPMKKSDPRLEALVINYLRHWRFTPLPSDALQDEQWGIIPFKFRIR